MSEKMHLHLSSIRESNQNICWHCGTEITTFLHKNTNNLHRYFCSTPCKLLYLVNNGYKLWNIN